MFINHSVKVWKMVPAARGIGLAVVVTMLINAVTNGVTVAYALYYLLFALQSVSNINKVSSHTCGISYLYWLCCKKAI